MCYNYFRIGKALQNLPVEERIKAATEKIEMISEQEINSLKAADIFPWVERLSKGIDATEFALSHLKQPDLYIRLRPGKEEIVKKKLIEAGQSFAIVSDSCLALANSTKVDKYIRLDHEAVIQDRNSQRVAEFFPALQKGAKVWDCCAGSGGKSILLYDQRPGIHLFLSDNRASILANLEKRFREAGIRNYRSGIIDLAGKKENIPFSELSFDFILADVPCTGSGTWARTPEQLFFFDPIKIEEYSKLQRQILWSIIPYLKPGGHILYSTCSVFKDENEENIELMTEEFKLSLIKKGLLKGYEEKADTLFAALLQKQL